MHLLILIPEFRDADRALQVAKRFRSVNLPPSVSCQILIIDDGSGDGSADRIEARLPVDVQLFRLPENRGRSGARNAGAAALPGDLLLFIDSDCLPHNEHFITEHLHEISAGAVASTGPVVGNGRGFWHQFQTKSSARRAALHGDGACYAGSTQNLMVRRNAFEEVGGFDESYSGYGFEDRDLLIRLGTHGTIGWAQDAVVEHLDDLTLRTVCRKMRDAGGHSSALFATRHPEAYRRLGYARLDARSHPAWRPLIPFLTLCLPVLVFFTSSILERRWIPFFARSGLVRILSGLSFLRGTADRYGEARQKTSPIY